MQTRTYPGEKKEKKLKNNSMNYTSYKSRTINMDFIEQFSVPHTLATLYFLQTKLSTYFAFELALHPVCVFEVHLCP